MALKRLKGLRVVTKYGTAEFYGNSPQLYFVLRAAEKSLLYRSHEFVSLSTLKRGAIEAGRLTSDDWPFNLASKLPF